MTPHLTDDFDAQDHHCASTGLYDEEPDEGELEWGGDPFNIVAQIEEDTGCPLNRS